MIQLCFNLMKRALGSNSFAFLLKVSPSAAISSCLSLKASQFFLKSICHRLLSPWSNHCKFHQILFVMLWMWSPRVVHICISSGFSGPKRINISRCINVPFLVFFEKQYPAAKNMYSGYSGCCFVYSIEKSDCTEPSVKF